MDDEEHNDEDDDDEEVTLHDELVGAVDGAAGAELREQEGEQVLRLEGVWSGGRWVPSCVRWEIGE